MRIKSSQILDIFYPYVQLFSETGTIHEKKASTFVYEHFLASPYFTNHNDQFGLYTLEEDPFKREVAWALVKGRGHKTVVLMQHLDVVGIEDFKRFKTLAFEPEELAKALLVDKSALSEEAYADLKSKEWIFGRGTADMKAGGAIQMAIIDAYCQKETFEGNILLLAVPDEENLSTGMRGAAALLSALKKEHQLDYALMINAEPHQRKDKDRGLLSGGSIGKILPFVYVRGVLAHAGKSAEGFNPLSILSQLVSLTEMNPLFSDIKPQVNEMSPLPTWLLMKDSKTTYDVSMPLSAFGLFSIQPLVNCPEKVLEKLISLAEDVVEEVSRKVNKASELYYKITNRNQNLTVWKPVVLSFSQLIQQGIASHGQKFDRYYHEEALKVLHRIQSGQLSHAAGTWYLIDCVIEYIGSEQPLVVIGLVPPYYPSVSYLDRPEYTLVIKKLKNSLSSFSEKHYNQQYDLEAYFTGISDLSYSSLKQKEAESVENAVSYNMPLYHIGYEIPFKDIANNSMPCINIGPWGKDFHKISERVLKEDLLNRTPALILHALNEVLKE